MPNSEPSYINTNAKTKIVCTLGPSSDSLETLEQLVNAGMSVARLNMSHGDIDTHSQVVQRVKEVSEKLKRPVGIMVDVPGAKYRTGELTTESINIETITCTRKNQCKHRVFFDTMTIHHQTLVKIHIIYIFISRF